MDFKALVKKAGIGTYLSLAVALLSLVSLIIYQVNCTSAGYFKGTMNGTVVVMSIFAIICSLGSVVLSQVKLEGVLQKVISFLSSGMLIGSAVLLISSLLVFVGGRIEGLGYIFGADENTLSEIQTAPNMASASTAIVGFVFYGITWVIALVAPFFKMVKEEKVD